MRQRLLQWWHRQRGYHAAPAIYQAWLGNKDYLRQECPCGAVKNIVVSGNRIGAAVVEYFYRWKA